VKLKNEEPVKVDAGQLARLVTGVTVDAGLASTEVGHQTSHTNSYTEIHVQQPTIRREKPAILEERKGIIRFVLVRNDGSPTSSLLLTGLKTLFQRQLPMMPKEYVTRLVFDRNSEALAVVMRGWKVVGGITYRPFPHRTFAEIVFFAVTGVYQVSVGVLLPFLVFILLIFLSKRVTEVY
jgi:histone acetyltransferase